MKIAFYINAIHEGGAQRVLVNLANELVEKGDEVILVTSFIGSWEYSYSNKIKRYVLDNNSVNDSKIKRNLTRVLKLRKILKHENPDCLLSFMAEPNYRSIVASLGLNNKVIISVRNDPNKEYRGISGKILGKLLLPLADGCVFQTPDAQKWFPKRLQKKSKIIYNAVKDDFFYTKRNVEANTIVTCGRLEEQKNHKMLINAFELVAKEHKKARLLIYGEGSLRNELEVMIENKGLSDNIKLCGNSDNIPEVLSKAEIFVLSSDYEGMPNALMEALAVGVPSISTDCPCGGPSMLIQDSENGELIESGNYMKLSLAILNLLGNDKLQDKYSYKSKKEAAQYRSSIIFKSWRKYMEKIIN